MVTPAISAQALCKQYGNTLAVNNLSLQIEKGELFALLGVNGAGKTTAIKMLSCLTPPTSGDALLMGHSITKEPGEVKKQISLSPQETAVAPNLSVRENLTLMCGLYGYPPAQARAMAKESIAAFQLTEIENTRAKTLSGGWQRRLSLAMALITRPQILFLDEPTLGLDVLARRSLWQTLEKLKGQITIILTTHYLEEAQALAGRIGVMAKGSLAAVGSAKELMQLTGTFRFEDAFIALATPSPEKGPA